ncbi:MAG: type II toxin-antitoxin system HicA family toxin [Patescibacteria group bacterium]
MPKLRTLSAKKIVSIFESLGFYVVKNKGGHIKLTRVSFLGKQVLTIPNHKELDKGTLVAIFNQAKRFVPEEELVRYFYTD